MPNKYYLNEKERALREALASTRMEGLPVTPEIEDHVRQILEGKITVEERICQIKKNQNKKEPPAQN